MVKSNYEVMSHEIENHFCIKTSDTPFVLQHFTGTSCQEPAFIINTKRSSNNKTWKKLRQS